MVLYVDDILLIGNDIHTLQSVKSWLGKCFSMKDLGEAAYILGIKIYRDRSKRLIGLSQSAYIDKVLKRFSMQDSKRGYLPMSHGITLSKSQCPNTKDERERMSKIPYASAIRSIMYAMLCTRPDVSYALSITSRYQSNPGESHWTAVKNILKYLRRSKDMFLVYGGLEDDLVVNGYTDASFQSNKDDFRSQSGYVFCLNVQLAGKVQSKALLLILQLKLNTLQHLMQQRKQFGSRCSLLTLKWFLALQILLMFIVTIMVLLHKERNLDHISDPNTFLGVIISLEKSLREVRLRYAEFQQMIMLLIH